MKSNLNQIYAVIQDSDLAQSKKLELFKLFKHANDKPLEDLARSLEEKPGFIRGIYENYKSKEQALRNDDLSALDDVMDKEVEMIKEI